MSGVERSLLSCRKGRKKRNEDLHTQFPTSSFLNSTVLILPPPLSILFLLPSFATPLFLSSPSSVPSAPPPERARKVGGKVFLGNKPFRHGFPFSPPPPSLRRRAISLLFREYFAACTVLGEKRFFTPFGGCIEMNELFSTFLLDLIAKNRTFCVPSNDS